MDMPKILVVDDEEDLCEILKFNLEIEGYEVYTAFSAEEALKMDIASYQLLLLEIEELSPVSHADQGQTEENSEAASKEAQAIWMKAFKTYVGRQPLPEEFLLGKSSGMMCQPSISLSQMVRQRNQPSQPWLRERKS